MWHEHKERALHEGLITAIAVGGFLIILGLVTVSVPNILDQINNFFGDLTTRSSPFASGTIQLPIPAHLHNHSAVFHAALNFAIGIAILQAIILPLRLLYKSTLRRIAETIGNLIFWVGAAIVANVFLLSFTSNGWFQYWASLIILAGVSLIAQGIVHLTASFGHHSK
jgi:hypothetical protein